MPWQDNLRPASFRRVAFFVDTAQVSAGRRLARHEYPQRDVPYLEDMGRKAREYKVEAFLVGPEYMADRDALLAAIEETGSGQLIHPYHGTLLVTASDCDLTESTQHGGLAKFSITFVEAGRRQEPEAASDTQTVLVHAIDDSDTALATDFAENFSVDDMPEFVTTDAIGNLNSLLAVPGMALGNLSWVRADPLSALTALLPENLQASLSDPLALAKGILQLVRNTESVLSLFAYNLPLSTSSITTPARQAQNDNRAALSTLVLAAATARRIGDIAEIGAQTVDDARLARAEIVARTDVVLLNEYTGQRSADSMVQLRTDVMAHFAAVTPTLPRLVSITPQSVRPAAVAAHDFYGDDWLDAAREDEIIARNNIRHPSFVPAGYPLQVVA